MKIHSDLVEENGGLICHYYRSFMVKRVDSGSPSGDVSVGVVPSPDQQSGACAPGHALNEISIKRNRKSFVGVKGDFIVMEFADPNGAMPFTIYDRRTGKPRYSDSVFGSGLTFLADENDVLHVRFRRGIDAECSLPKDGQACWGKVARQARFPSVLARAPAPVVSCTAIYKQRKAPFEDPSIIVYDVELNVSSDGVTHVISRGEPSCEPQP